MLRKYLVLGIMMGALALTGCGAEEKKDNDKDEVKATQEAGKDNEETTLDDDKTAEEDKTSEDKESVDENTESKEENKEETDQTKDLYYMCDGEKENVEEWSKGIDSNILYYYGPSYGPKSSGGGDYFKGRYTRMSIGQSLLVEGDCSLEEALVSEYRVLSYVSGISGDGIKDVTGEYVTVNGIECYRYQGMASTASDRETYVVGYLFDNHGYKVMIQSHVLTKDESEMDAAIEEANHNVDMAVKGLRLKAN